MPSVVAVGLLEGRVAFLWSWLHGLGGSRLFLAYWGWSWVPTWLSFWQARGRVWGLCQPAGGQGWGASTNRLEENSKVVCSSTSVIGVEQTPKNSWPRLLSNYCLSVGTQSMWHFACALESRILFLYPSSSPEHKLCWFFTARHSGGSSFQCKTPGLGTPFGAQTPRSL